jgi:hypothetical protein
MSFRCNGIPLCFGHRLRILQIKARLNEHQSDLVRTHFDIRRLSWTGDASALPFVTDVHLSHAYS